MPKLPDQNAKTLRLVLVPKEGQEVKIRAFKEIVARNGYCISDILFEKVEEFLKVHNWPPGNSQTLISVFTEDIKTEEKRCYCGEKAEYEAYSLEEEKFYLCTAHFIQNRDARLLRRWKKT